MPDTTDENPAISSGGRAEPTIRTASARRIPEGSRSKPGGSLPTGWARGVDRLGVFERLTFLFSVVLVALQPGGTAVALPLVLAAIRPRVPFLAAAAGGAVAGIAVLWPGTSVIDNQPGPGWLGLIVTVVLGLAAAAAAVARAVEHPAERELEWQIPVLVLGIAVAGSWFLVVSSTLSQGGGTLAPFFLQIGVRGAPGLLVWPLAMAATLAFLPRRAAKIALPVVIAPAVIALWLATGGFRLWERGNDRLAIRGPTRALVEQVTSQILFKKDHIIEARFRPSALRVAPDGPSHALGALVSAKRGVVYQWRVFPANGAQPFITRACDIGFITGDHVLALVPVVGELGHTGYELVEVAPSGTIATGVQLPLLARPRFAFDHESGRWSVHGTEQPLVGLFQSRTANGFMLRLFDGSVAVRVAPQTVFEGFEDIDDLTTRDRVRVELAGPGYEGAAAMVVRDESTGQQTSRVERSTLIRVSGRIGYPTSKTTRWAVDAAGPVTWTPLDDNVALAQISLNDPYRDIDSLAPSRWADDGTARPEFELLAVSRRGRTTVARFGLAVVCRAAGVDAGMAVCTASDDRSVSVWRAVVEEDIVALDPLVSFRAPFVAPSTVTAEVSVVKGPQTGLIAIDHELGKAGHLELPALAVPGSLIATGPRDLAIMTRGGLTTGVIAFRLSGGL